MAVARAAELGPKERDRLHQRIDRLAAPYHDYFLKWLRRTQVDWTVAVNMTLSDAVPVTKALHTAVRARHQETGSGGVLFWDHDLFASCAVHDDDGIRMYPARPNEFTPLPEAGAGVRWAVVSQGLAEETASYPVPEQPQVVPNILPSVPAGPLDTRHERFLGDHDLDPTRPVLLNPVRVFRVKGVELALELLAAARSAGTDHGRPAPYLLVFGSLAEDPGYAAEVLATARRLDLLSDVRFLDGVPLSSGQNSAGSWQLDEVDLLRIAAATGGGIVFTPNTEDVETVGLGPALAAAAGLPCAVTSYTAFTPQYGPDFSVIPVDPSQAGMRRAGEELVAAMHANRSGDRRTTGLLHRNREIVDRRFPVEPWAKLLTDLAANTGAGSVD
ncbi:hypothetical protein [Streptomyces sp. NPDC018059]|uniref:hypothetical protein n=1 Tax=Streptomyces sp. NPDC018059 TaxID=3365041 RepID=UPI00379E44B3